MKIIYDLETNGLVDTVSTIWIAVTKNIETNEIITFSDYDKDSKPLNELLPFLNKAKVLIGHNIINYDNVVLHKLLDFEKLLIFLVTQCTVMQNSSYQANLFYLLYLISDC